MRSKDDRDERSVPGAVDELEHPYLSCPASLLPVTAMPERRLVWKKLVDGKGFGLIDLLLLNLYIGFENIS